MSDYFNSTITRDEQCKDLVDVNPDVTGLGVVVTMLIHSILVVGITLCISFLPLFDPKDPSRHPHCKELRHALAKGLYKVCGVLYGTFFAQLIASLVIFDSLSFDQRFLIAATQIIGTVQITTSGLFFEFYDLLHDAHTTLCLVQSGLSFAYGIMAMRPDKHPLEKQCLVSYWPSGLSSSALRPDILAMLGACWWAIVLVYLSVKSFLRRKKQPKASTNISKHGTLEVSTTAAQGGRALEAALKDGTPEASKTAAQSIRALEATSKDETLEASMTAAQGYGTSDKTSKLRVTSIVLACYTTCCWVVMVYFTITTYLTAGHLKKGSADQELRSFGQILALCTIGGSVWQLTVCIIRGLRKIPIGSLWQFLGIIRTPSAPSTEPQVSPDLEKGVHTTASEVNEKKT